MPVIAISRGTFSRAKQIAVKAAQALQYECVSREVLLEASELFNVSEFQLIHAIADAPSFLERFSHGKEKYIAYIRAALLRHIQSGNGVYHGFAGHLFLQGISHVIKVRIIATLEDRILEKMKQESLNETEAREIIERDDSERRSWSLSLYGVDPWDPMLYDLTLHLNPMTVDDAVRVLVQTAGLASFQVTPESMKALNDRVLAAQVQALLVHEFPHITVKAKDGEAFIDIHAGLMKMTLLNREAQQETLRRVEEIAVSLGGAEKATATLLW